MIIDYSDERGLLKDTHREEIAAAASEVVRRELPNAMEEEHRLLVSVTIVDPEEIQSINAEYRSIDAVTDVLSFPQYESADAIYKELTHFDTSTEIPVGDVVLCYERALEQAEEYGNTPDREITYLFVHSMLHLLGYDHMEEEEKRVMRIHEEAVMEAIGLTRAL